MWAKSVSPKSDFRQTNKSNALFGVFNNKRMKLTNEMNIAVRNQNNNKNKARSSSLRGQKEK